MNGKTATIKHILNSICTIAVGCCLSLSLLCVYRANASEITDTAKVIGGMGPTEIMALVTLTSISALVLVVKVFVGRFLKSLDALVAEIKARPCIYLKPPVKNDD